MAAKDPSAVTRRRRPRAWRWVRGMLITVGVLALLAGSGVAVAALWALIAKEGFHAVAADD